VEVELKWSGSGVKNFEISMYCPFCATIHSSSRHSFAIAELLIRIESVYRK